ncbi:MAG: sigma 54-interacting transcriptional regulator [Myxococcales bacterium]
MSEFDNPHEEPTRPFEVQGTDVLPSGAGAPLRLKVVVVTGNDAGKSLQLETGSYRVGKGSDNDLVLDDSAVSRTHLEVAVLDGRVRFRDLDSTNGSWCNEMRFREIEGTPGTVVRIGKTTLKVMPVDTARRPALAASARKEFGRLYGSSLAMRQVFAMLERVSPTDAGVLVEGETGTGKELCAEAIHKHSSRSKAPFVVVDLAGIQPNLIESELFGHVRGAFTGASSDRAGAFERANGGTVFLDEIGELAPEIQPRLLRALENRQIKRVGGNDYRHFDARVVAATNRDLLAESRQGRFREDLYHRLAVVKVGIPPLRARREDIPMLVERILETLGRPATTLGPATMAMLSSYDWPGNVRELRNVVERAVSLSGADGEVPPELLELPEAGGGGSALSVEGLPFKEAKERLVASFERDYVAALLERCDGNVSKAAREAGIDRVYLHRLLKKHGLGNG